eukprot:TRINITY_DN32332_c0_g1_i2.p1 TRINITY_DN32332_c0_g1~~TRINITY_DN32332_c0_g1_i2.p1  ORF type:complete len:1406 (+),score=137.82 TRINITY_DN32332_c0_g1_i2:79-4218(+)
MRPAPGGAVPRPWIGVAGGGLCCLATAVGAAAPPGGSVVAPSGAPTVASTNAPTVRPRIGVDWKLQPATGAPPTGRTGAELHFHSDGQLWLLGGRDQETQTDLWRWAPAERRWYPEYHAPPPPRLNAATWFVGGGSTPSIYLLGGKEANLNLLDDFWRFDPNERKWRRIVVGLPPPRQLAATCAQPGAPWAGGGDGLWVFGGRGGTGTVGDLWRYPVTTAGAGVGTTGWTEVAVARGAGPGLREGAAAVWDNTSRRMWLIGGTTGDGGYSAELWSMQPSATGSAVWRLATAAPSSAAGALRREGAAAAVMSGVLYVIGGWAEGAGPQGDVWSCAGPASSAPRWTQLQGSDPLGQRDGAAAAAGAGKVWIFGGRGQGTLRNDLLTLTPQPAAAPTSLTVERETTPQTVPYRRAFASLCIVRGDALLFGGTDTGPGAVMSGTQVPLADLWVLPAASSAGTAATDPKWREVHADGDWPSPRLGHTATQYSGSMVVFGGMGDHGVALGDLWVYLHESARWEQRETESGPPARWWHAAAVSGCTGSGRCELLIAGGEAGGGRLLGDLWAYDLGRRQWRSAAASPLLERVGSSALSLPGNGMLVLGGEDMLGTALPSSVRVSLGGGQDYAVSLGEDSAPFAFGAAVPVSGSTAALIGGERNARVQSPLSAYLWPQGFAFSHSAVVPRGRSGHAAARAGTRVLVFGGHPSAPDDRRREGFTSAELWVGTFGCPPADLSCFPCPPGTVVHAAGCVPCAPGSYSEGWAASNCSSCRGGTEQPYEGASSLLDCHYCPSGTYAPSAGTSQCTPCTTAVASSIECVNANFSRAAVSQPVGSTVRASWSTTSRAISMWCAVGFAGTAFALVVLFVAADWRCCGLLPSEETLLVDRPQDDEAEVGWVLDRNLKVLAVHRNSAAAKSGIVAGAKLLRVAGRDVRTQADVQSAVGADRGTTAFYVIAKVPQRCSFRRLDLFATEHRYLDGTFRRRVRSPHGGLATVLAGLATAALAVSTVVHAVVSGERESRLLSDFGLFPAAQRALFAAEEVTLGACFVGGSTPCSSTSNGSCAGGSRIVMAGLVCEKESLACTQSGSGASLACEMTWRGHECHYANHLDPTAASAGATAEVLFAQEDEAAAARYIEWWASSTSGLPGELSKVSGGSFAAPGGGLLHGEPPSRVTLETTPTTWRRALTGEQLWGWHLFLDSQSTGGSTAGAGVRHSARVALSVILRESPGMLELLIRPHHMPLFLVALLICTPTGVVIAGLGLIWVIERIAYSADGGFYPAVYEGLGFGMAAAHQAAKKQDPGERAAESDAESQNTTDGSVGRSTAAGRSQGAMSRSPSVSQSLSRGRAMSLHPRRSLPAREAQSPRSASRRPQSPRFASPSQT